MADDTTIINDNQYAPGVQDYDSETKSWPELFRIAVDQWVRNNLNIWVPCQVTKIYDNSFVDVQILIQETFQVQGLVTVPTLLNIPVEHPRGTDWWIKLPVAVGDYGRVTFCDRSLDNWIVQGGGPLDPQDTRMHSYSDGVFVPGLYPRSMPLAGPPTEMILHNGQAEIHIQKPGTFLIENSSNELIDLLDKITNQLELLSTTLSTDTTNTVFGPMQLNAFNTYATIATTVTALKLKLETLKKDLNMALQPIATGKAIADYFIANAPAAGTPITDTQLESIWEGAITILYADFAANAQVLPGSFTSPDGAVSGVGGPIE